MRRARTVLAAAVLVAACSPGPQRVVVAAGTTVVDSGFLDHVAAAYEMAHPGVEVSVVAQPTRLALELGRDGAADVTITHAPKQELAMVDSGVATYSAVVFTSQFVLVGPPESENVFAGYELPEVLREVFDSGTPFVTRGDGSGTHDKEMENWLEAGFDPEGQAWYSETGQGMGPTLLIADQRGAMTLSELGAFLAAASTIGLVDLRLDPGALENPYTALVMASSRRPDLARGFVEWLQSDAGAAAIDQANQDLFGTIIYAHGSRG